MSDLIVKCEICKKIIDLKKDYFITQRFKDKNLFICNYWKCMELIPDL